MRSFIFISNMIDDIDQYHVWMCGYNFEMNGKPVKVDDYTANILMNNKHFAEQ
jgi:hypothetical protein